MRKKFGKDYFLGRGSHYRGYTEEEMLPYAKRNLDLTRNFVKIKKGLRILDIGCAGGFFLKLCDEMGLATYGVDVSEYAIKFAKKNTKAKLICQSADRSLPFEDNFFDIITMFVTIEHLKNPENALRECRRVLKQNGTLIITTNSKWSFYNFLQIFSKKYADDETHISIKSISEWKNIIHDIGLKIKFAKTYHFPGQMRIKEKFGLDIDKILPFFKEGILIVAQK